MFSLPFFFKEIVQICSNISHNFRDCESEFEEKASHSQLKREKPPLIMITSDNISVQGK